MKIEFRKVPTTPKEFTNNFASVKLEGSFCKISPTLIKVDAQLTGETPVLCIRCGEEENINLDEKLDFLLSDGMFKDNESEDLVIEIENGIIDFDEICESELSSIESDYHICKNCLDDNIKIEKEF
ncbi:hypothetical protein [Arcobacter sp. CECT 8985]|uniref:hypothetical protein n=1 Tax=Arcobacter sp. CECT 8985 TaxID=1935424 RepID=UPI00100BEF4E|nr:hypothetical protein [Arcobacter sp. CECT 8985]RXJ87759.1 hypothetical protein CRU93_02905 [Arcobacter sp. CECT 8985]